MKKILLFISIHLFVTTILLAQQHQLVKKWETDSVFKVPESVLFDEKNNVLYVANIDGKDPWAKDGAGSVGKVGADGKVIAVDWVPGLHSPKGMGLHKGKLYVADMTDLVVIDVQKGSIDKLIPVTNSVGLNDVTVDKDGVIYVSDSRAKKVFRVKDGVSELFLDSLKGPNGVLIHGDDFFLLDAGGMYKLNKDKSLTKITDGMEGGTDGIENVKGKEYIISCWAGVVYYVNEDGTKEKILDGRPEKMNSADIGFDPKTKTVFVPTFWRNSVAAYEVK